MVEQIDGDLQGQAGFADAAWSRKGEQTDLFLEQKLLDGRQVMVSPDERAAGQE
jgi:hypothetical protein